MKKFNKNICIALLIFLFFWSFVLNILQSRHIDKLIVQLHELDYCCAPLVAEPADSTLIISEDY